MAATIVINPDDKSKEVDVQTGGLSNIEMLDYLHNLSQFFSKAIVNEAAEIGVSITNEKEFEDYLSFLRKNKI
jgi:hypothetical protein